MGLGLGGGKVGCRRDTQRTGTREVVVVVVVWERMGCSGTNGLCYGHRQQTETHRNMLNRTNKQTNTQKRQQETKQTQKDKQTCNLLSKVEKEA